MFEHRAAHRGRERLRSIRGGGGGGRIGALLLALGAFFLRTAGLGAFGGGRGAFLDHGDDRLDLDGVADRDLEFLDHARDGRGRLDGDLVGLEADDRLVDRDGIADVLEQFADGRFGDRFTQRGNFDFGGHNLAFPDYLQSLRTLGASPFSPSAILTRASCCT